MSTPTAPLTMPNAAVDAAVVADQSVTPVKSKGDERQYRVITLPNSLQAVLISDPETDKSAAAMDVCTGHWSDPAQLPGLAHFLEHMLFLGTDKFPDENEYNAFLNAHGGSSNAYTSSEDTNYYFDVRFEYLAPMLERFASFFTGPLFTASATDREIQAVHNENSKNVLSDMWRSSQLIKHLALPSHPFHKFGTGNQSTLKDEPKKLGIDVRGELLAFHQRYYSANTMKLALIGRESLDELQQYVMTYFSSVQNKQLSIPSFPSTVFDLSPSSSLHRSKLCVVPVKDLRSLTLLFPMPSTIQHYHEKPSYLLSHLIGHESNGSILSLLKSLSYANGLSAGLYENSSAFSLFSISVELTEMGLTKIIEVITIIFAYIAVMRAADTAEWQRIYTEERAIHNINFDFKSKESPANYVSHLAGDMHHYPAYELLTAGHLYSEFSEILIRKFLDCLSVDNMLVKVTSQSFADRATDSEPWYETKYCLEQFTDSEWSQVRAKQQFDALHLPAPNDFIATDFTLKHAPVSPTALNNHANVNGDSVSEEVSGNGLASHLVPPQLIAKSSDCGVNVWWKPDRTFLKPKANVVVRLVSPISYNSPRHSVLTALYVKLLEDSLNEFSYYADLAGLSYNFYPTPSGIQIIFSGYNHKLPVLITEVVKEMKSLSVSSERFVVLKEQLKRQYSNWAKQQPYEHALYNEMLASETLVWSNSEKLSVIDGIEVGDIAHHSKSLWRFAEATTLSHGNMLDSEAIEVSTMIAKILGFQPLFESQLPDLRVVKFESGLQYKYYQSVLNPNDKNSAISLSYQIGPDTVDNSAVLELFAQIVRDSVFNQLRTIEQLGYLVWSGISNHRGIVSFRIIVQSGDFSPLHLEARAEAFLAAFRQELISTTSELFASHCAAVIAKKREKDKTLSAETTRHWNEINIRRYQFDRQSNEIAMIESLTLEKLTAFFDHFLDYSKQQRTKLLVAMFGKDQQIDRRSPQQIEAENAAATASGETAEEPRAVTAVESPAPEIAENEIEVAEEKIVHTEDVPAATVKTLPPVPADLAPVVMIDNFAAFKRAMPLYACCT